MRMSVVIAAVGYTTRMKESRSWSLREACGTASVLGGTCREVDHMKLPIMNLRQRTLAKLRHMRSDMKNVTTRGYCLTLSK